MEDLLKMTKPNKLRPDSSSTPTALSHRLNALRRDNELNNPLTQNQYIVRARALPLLAEASKKGLEPIKQGQEGFATPSNLSSLDLRGLGLVAHGFSPRNAKILAKHVSPLQHMVLIAHEATPRPLGFAMNGYTPSDFIAYIYQDVAERFINTHDIRNPRFTREKANRIKMWLAESVPRKQHSPQRHIRRRLMSMLNRTNQQINSLLIDREVSPEMTLLFRKLMERDDNLGYMQGQLRDFNLVRDDFNLLAETITFNHYIYTGEQERADAFMRVDCPSTIHDFSLLKIDKPRSTNKNKNE